VGGHLVGSHPGWPGRGRHRCVHARHLLPQRTDRPGRGGGVGGADPAAPVAVAGGWPGVRGGRRLPRPGPHPTARRLGLHPTCPRRLGQRVRALWLLQGGGERVGALPAHRCRPGQLRVPLLPVRAGRG
jgi:hypothetical protein